MRGSPPLQLALILIGFMLMSVPLIRLTTGRAVVPLAAVSKAVAGSAVPTQVRLRWAHQPRSLSMTLDGKPLLESLDLASSQMEGEAEVVIPKDGIEVAIAADWPDGTPDTALTLELEPDERDAQSLTRWSVGGKMQEVLFFQWK